MSLSSNCIIHFTKTSDALKGILQDNFKVKYCLENIKLITELNYAAPMVSFCDIPLSQIKDHIGKYGAYGIGLTKEWAQKNKLNPVVYLQSDSFLSKSIDESYRAIALTEGFDWDSATDTQKHLLNVLRYVKNYEADLSRGGEVIKDYRFSDEREWRFTPEYHDCKEIAINPTFYKSEEDKQKINDAIVHLRLEFEPNDIKYIIIERESEISEFVEILKKSKGNKYTYNDVERLMTRIITSEQIKTDL
ncbi:abortive infection system antitoxin AbiGi family protein [Flavobacterium azooxidireducens]|uniref:Abortive infection system antitoxin AbiGi family protein n=1 Tax=Flavobacterium azooxidireducens TaxID=1871076 RepID=A0ABY4KDR9_9FLAO|nr:abortive infection system antitoxin AbiGi family protein [Flavobacterium azooxidireducens]UPQ78939.1 abortive infection system antitoxin AbiGi family protein [Flavobacterium azooxidireducens]